MSSFTMRVTFGLCALLLLSTPVAANTYTVINTQDSGAGSLRQAISDASTPGGGSHDIVFSAAYPLQGQIVLQSALPTIGATELAINGGDREPEIDGQGMYRIFSTGGTTQRLELRDLSLVNGFSNQAGGCVNGGSSGGGGFLLVERVSFDSCQASGTSLIRGGAIDWSRELGSMTLTDSSFVDNLVTATQAGGTSYGGAVYTVANLLATRVRFEGNAAIAANGGGLGGAINLGGSGRSSFISNATFRYNAASPLSPSFGYGGAINVYCDGCSVQIDRSYLRGNAANRGGAIHASKLSSGANDVNVRLYNSSFYNNDAAESGGAVAASAGSILSSTNVSFHGNSAASGAQLAFLFGAEVNYFLANLLAAPAINACTGTPAITDSLAITTNLLTDPISCSALANESLPASPLGNFSEDESPGEIGVLRFDGSAVIDSISDAAYCDSEDARGQSRPLDGDGDGIAACDVGAFEDPGALVFTDGFE